MKPKNSSESQQWYKRFLKPVIPTLIAQGLVGPCLVLKDARQAGKKSSDWQIWKEAWQQEGLRGLYRGNGWNLAKTLPNAVLVVNFTDINIQNLKPFIGSPLLTTMLCAPLSGMFEMAMTVPAEAYERARQTQKPVFNAISMQYKKLWQTMAARNSVGTAGTFIGRELMKITEEHRNLSMPEKAAFLTASGLVTTTVTVPFDALVRRAYVTNIAKPLATLAFESVKELGIKGALTAGWKGRILSAGFPIIANQFSAVWIDRTAQETTDEPETMVQHILSKREKNKSNQDKER